MTELTPVPVASVAGMIFSLILSIGLPIALLVFLRNRTGGRHRRPLLSGSRRAVKPFQSLLKTLSCRAFFTRSKSPTSGHWMDTTSPARGSTVVIWPKAPSAL